MSYFDNCKIKFLNISGEDMPDSKYFSLPGISNSKLKLINPLEEGSPEKYLQGFDNSYNSSLQLGSATHCLFLQKDDYELSSYEGKPSAKLGVFVEAVYEFRQQGWSIKDSINMASKKADYYNNKLTQTIIKKAIKQGLDYYLRLVRKEFTNDKEVIVLDKKQLETCKTCLKSINNNVTVKKFLSENIFEEKQFLNEIALFSDCEVTLPDGKIIPLKLKGKLDQVIIDPEAKIIYLNDLKTTSKPLEYFMGKVINDKCYDGVFESHHYFRQMAKLYGPLN